MIDTVALGTHDDVSGSLGILEVVGSDLGAVEDAVKVDCAVQVEYQLPSLQ